MSERPLRVAFLGHVARLSGAELAMVRLIGALGDRVEAHVLLAEDGPLVPMLREAGASVHVVPLDDRVRDVRRASVAGAVRDPRQLLAGGRYLGRLVRRLRAIEPDVVHAYTLKAGVYGALAARLLRAPSVWHVHDRIADDYLPARTATVMRGLIRSLPDVAVANSKATLATIDAPRAGARVIHNPLQATRAHAPVPDGCFRIGMVGRIAPWKGHEVFLRAFADAFAADEPVRAVVVGAALFGEEAAEQALRHVVAERGLSARVELRGFRQDVREELARLDVLVHASIVPEPFGQVVLEGMAAGLPVVATREGGPGEIVEDGESGLLYPAGDVAELAARLSRLRTDAALRTRLGDAGRERSRAFAPGPIAQQWLAVYAGLARGRQSSHT